MKKTSLQDRARLFAQNLSELLNNTVTDGITISATTFPNALQEVLLGCGIGRNNLTPQSIPLSRNRNKANVYLKYMHRCGLDDDDTHLATLISTMNLYTSEEISNESLLLGIDYTRDPKNDFPRAHLHVAGERDDLDAIYLGSTRNLRDRRPSPRLRHPASPGNPTGVPSAQTSVRAVSVPTTIENATGNSLRVSWPAVTQSNGGGAIAG